MNLIQSHISILIISWLFFNKVQAQDSTTYNMVQFTGKVFDELLQPLPYVNLLVTNKYQGVITDRQGKFSFIVQPGDSVQISYMGYKKNNFVIPNDLTKKFYVRDVMLQSDTFMIAEIEVYPWKDYEEFKEHFEKLELPEGDMQRAMKNIAIMKAHIKMDRSPSRVGNFNHIMEQQYKDMMYRGQYPTYQIFNAVSWVKFIEALQNGDFKKKD